MGFFIFKSQTKVVKVLRQTHLNFVKSKHELPKKRYLFVAKITGNISYLNCCIFHSQRIFFEKKIEIFQEPFYHCA